LKGVDSVKANFGGHGCAVAPDVAVQSQSHHASAIVIFLTDTFVASSVALATAAETESD